MLIVTLEGLLGFVRIINLVIRLTIPPFSGGGERERGDRPLRPSATAGYPATRCALKARRATAAPAGWRTARGTRGCSPAAGRPLRGPPRRPSGADRDLAPGSAES